MLQRSEAKEYGATIRLLDATMAKTIADRLELRVIQLTNAERTRAGLESVHTEVHLNSTAQDHSDWMAKQGAFSHTGENGSTPEDRAEEAGFPIGTGLWSITENVAYRSISGLIDEDEIASMHRALMDSPSHRANILDPDVDYIGVGLSEGQSIVQGEPREGVFLTQNFGNSSEPVIVQEQVDGETVLTTYVAGAAVPGTSQRPVATDDGVAFDPNDENDPQEDDPQEDDLEDENTAADGSCFVATAAYGSPFHPDVVTLRHFRDELLVRHRIGRAFVHAYWIIGPRISPFVRPNHLTGRLARLMLRPCVIAAERLLRHNR